MTFHFKCWKNTGSVSDAEAVKMEMGIKTRGYFFSPLCIFWPLLLDWNSYVAAKGCWKKMNFWAVVELGLSPGQGSRPWALLPEPLSQPGAPCQRGHGQRESWGRLCSGPPHRVTGKRWCSPCPSSHIGWLLDDLLPLLSESLKKYSAHQKTSWASPYVYPSSKTHCDSSFLTLNIPFK